MFLGLDLFLGFWGIDEMILCQTMFGVWLHALFDRVKSKAFRLIITSPLTDSLQSLCLDDQNAFWIHMILL